MPYPYDNIPVVSLGDITFAQCRWSFHGHLGYPWLACWHWLKSRVKNVKLSYFASSECGDIRDPVNDMSWF
jgi:hypothetical protein